jgi:hypothetical protein
MEITEKTKRKTETKKINGFSKKLLPIFPSIKFKIALVPPQEGQGK